MLDKRPGHVETRAARRAVVIDVVDGYLRHAELVEYALAARAITVAVAGHALVDVVVVDLRVQQRLYTGLETQFCVVDFSSGFDELGHAYAEDVNGGFLAR